MGPRYSTYLHPGRCRKTVTIKQTLVTYIHTRGVFVRSVSVAPNSNPCVTESDLDYHQNLMVPSLAHVPPFHRIL